MKLSKKEFIAVINNTPLVSIDIIIRDSDDRILMGFRTNEPAKNYWFVPGGRILKNESNKDAFERIVEKELGHKFKFEEAKLLNAYNHFYETNFANAPNVETHYVVLAYELFATGEQINALVNSPDEQHTDLDWISIHDLENKSVHHYSKAYFEKPSR
ncbi:GDP-mannose mannosyl hydrolase [Flavobacteriaceae bacterium MHTCC 0001]